MKFFSSFAGCILFTGLFYSVYGQTVFDNVISPADMTFHLYKTRGGANYTKFEVYSCSSSVFNKDSCRCTEFRAYDNQGQLISMIVGDDIKRNKIDYSVTQKAISDSLAKIEIEYAPTYLKTKLYAYSVDTSNENNIQSVIDFDTLDVMPKKVTHYNTSGKLLNVFYPRGLRKATKEFSDTLIREFGKIISMHQYFIENEIHSISTYNKINKITEGIFINNSYSRGYEFIKDIYFYDSSGKLSSITHTNQFNQTTGFDKFFYENNKLIKSIKFCNSDGLNCYEEKIYDSNSNLIEEKDQSGYKKHFYSNNLKTQTDWYNSENRFLFSEFNKYY